MKRKVVIKTLLIKQQVFSNNWFTGAQGLIDQAQRQLKAAKGNKIIWYFADEVSLNAVKALFKQEGIQGIELVLKALK